MQQLWKLNNYSTMSHVTYHRCDTSHMICHLIYVSYVSYVWCHTCDMSHVKCHMWHITCVTRHMWYVTLRVTHVTLNMRYVTCDVLYMWHHVWHVTCKMAASRSWASNNKDSHQKTLDELVVMMVFVEHSLQLLFDSLVLCRQSCNSTQ